jgi:benzodiazapine receptor
VRHLGWLPALTGVLNTVWLLLFQYELFLLTVPVMIALLVTLITIHQRLWAVRDQLTTVTRWTIRYPFSIYLGWITVATIANIAQTLSSIGVGGFGLQAETAIAGVVLLIGLAIAITFVRRFRDVAYGAVIVWAYVGIVVKEIDTPIVPFVAGAGALLVAGLLALVVIERTRRGSSRPSPA